MNDIPRATLEKLNDKGNGVRVEFFWLGDRLGHLISSVNDGVASAQWRSVDDDPLGPVFQELHEQENADGGKIAFLSGSGNGAHWSASVMFEKEACRLTFDVAARVREAPTERAIEYHSELRPVTVTASLLHDAGRCEWSEAQKLVRFLSSDTGEKLPVTLRYKYAFQ